MPNNATSESILQTQHVQKAVHHCLHRYISCSCALHRYCVSYKVKVQGNWGIKQVY